jgi:hypothetical protein
MSVSTIILTQDNLVNLNDGNNQLVFRFPNSVRLSNHAIAVSSITMYYSWFNITSAFQNNTFQYTWVDTTGTINTYDVIIPDGVYDISTINSYFQSVMVDNGTYAINTSGEYVYYLEMVVNASQYKIQINSYQVPATFPLGWTTPPAGYFLSNPQIFIPSNFNTIVGYVPNFTFPATTLPQGNISALSSVAPQVNPNPTLFLTCSGIQNPYTIPSSILYSISPNANVGEQINFIPPQLVFNKLLEGTYDRLVFAWLGTNNLPIIINDPAMTITLEIRNTKQDLGMITDALLGNKG